MRKTACGKMGLQVSRIGLGCMGMSSTYGQADDAQVNNALHAALEAEMTFWDTADVYGNGKNEILLSHLLSDRREKIVLATKCGITGVNADGLTLNGRPDYIAKSCEASLKRLGIEYLDLYYLHRVDPGVPIEESVGAMGELVSRGLVRFVGLSEASVQDIRKGHGEYPLSAVQSEYSLFTRGVEAEVLPLLTELGIGLVAYSPLGRGYLTGDISDTTELEANDFRRQLPRFQAENLKKNSALIQRLQSVARNRGSTPAQVALAWLLQRGDHVIPIPGTKRPAYVLENAQAARIQLSEKEFEALDFSEDSIAGARYPSKLAKAIRA